MQGIVIACNGELNSRRRRLAKPRFAVCTIPIASLRNGWDSDISQLVGFPLRLHHHYTAVFEGLENPDAEALALSCCVGPLFETVNKDGGYLEFGQTPMPWTDDVGNFLVVRDDGEPLLVEHLEVLCSFIHTELTFAIEGADNVSDAFRRSKPQEALDITTPMAFKEYFTMYQKDEAIANPHWARVRFPAETGEGPVSDLQRRLVKDLKRASVNDIFEHPASNRELALCLLIDDLHARLVVAGKITPVFAASILGRTSSTSKLLR